MLNVTVVLRPESTQNYLRCRRWEETTPTFPGLTLAMVRHSPGLPLPDLLPRHDLLDLLSLSASAAHTMSFPLMLAQLVSPLERSHASEATTRLHTRIVSREVQCHMSLKLMWAIEPGGRHAAWESACQDLGLLPAAWDIGDAVADYDGSCVGYYGGDGIGIGQSWKCVVLERICAVGNIVVLSKPRYGRIVGECRRMWSTGDVADTGAKLLADEIATMFTAGRRLVAWSRAMGELQVRPNKVLPACRSKHQHPAKKKKLTQAIAAQRQQSQGHPDPGRWPPRANPRR